VNEKTINQIQSNFDEMYTMLIEKNDCEAYNSKERFCERHNRELHSDLKNMEVNLKHLRLYQRGILNPDSEYGAGGTVINPRSFVNNSFFTTEIITQLERDVKRLTTKLNKCICRKKYNYSFLHVIDDE
jgi:hypothetical protein